MPLMDHSCAVSTSDWYNYTVHPWCREAGTEGMGMVSQGRGMVVAMATPTKAMDTANIAMASQVRARSRMGPIRQAALGSLDEPNKA